MFIVNPFTAPAGKISRLKKCKQTRLQFAYFDCPITKLLSILCILIEIVSRAHAKGDKSVVISNLALLLVVFRVTGGKHGSERVKDFLRLSSLNAVNGGSGAGVRDTGHC